MKQAPLGEDCRAPSVERLASLRILHVHATPGAVAGSERSLHLSAEGLRRLGYRNQLLCATAAGLQRSVPFDSIRERADLFDDSPLPPWRVARLRRELLGFIESMSPDIVHVRLGLRPSLISSLAGGWPTVYSAHLPVCPNGARHLYRDRVACEKTVGPMCFLSGFVLHGCGHLSNGEPVSPAAFARMMTTSRAHLRALQHLRVVIASSRWQAGMLARDGVPSERIAVVHPPVSPLPCVDARCPPALAFVGRLVEFKGADHLLRASALVDADHEVWLIGEGPARERLRQLARELALEHRVRFWGEVTPVRLGRILSHAKVVVVPSLWAETFNQVGAQAAAGGHRVVAYAAGGILDWADVYPNVTLVEQGNWHLLADAIARHLGGEPVAAGKRGNPFSVDRHIDALLNVYGRALGRPTGDEAQ